MQATPARETQRFDDIPQLLISDCTACTGLCCKCFAFDVCDEFAIDKPAGVPCPNLTADDRCSIHSRLAETGFSGCVIFDCKGAGPWLLRAKENAGSSGTGYSEIDAFRAARSIRIALEHIYTAGGLALTSEQRRERQRLLVILTPQISAAAALIKNFESGGLPAEIKAFIQSLRPLAGYAPATPLRRAAPNTTS